MACLLPFVFPLEDQMPPSLLNVEDEPLSPTEVPVPARPSARPRPAKRPLHRLLTGRTLPETPTDWKHLLGSVKREYHAGQYRECLERCNEVLDNVRQLSYFQAAYLIYLHFYAACALETQVRSLHSSSAHRVKILRQARNHYARASALVKIEDEDIARRSRSSSAASVDAVSPLEPGGSWQSTSHGHLRSRTPSLTFSDCDARLASRSKKQVRFSETVLVEPIAAEPAIRPDSPTLGFDDWVPEFPVEHHVSSPSLKSIKPALSIPTATFTAMPNGVEFNDPFAQDRALHRYIAILDSLRQQLPAHLATLDTELMTRERARPQAPSNDELRGLELKTRIERLRASGWQRRRFDTSRYEALRENVLADLMM